MGMARKRTNPDFLNGVPEMLILRLVAARPMYGYELVQAIRLATSGRLEFGEGCVYPLLHRLEADRLLASRRENVAGRDRFVYRATAQGRKQLAERVRAWEEIAGAIRRVIGPAVEWGVESGE